MKTIAGETVLLTGASRGVGVFIARALAKEQVTVLGVSRSKEGLDKICGEVETAGGRGIGIPFDIRKVAELSALMQQVNELADPIDILINNAGIEKYGAFTDYDLEDLQSVLSTNLLAAMELTRLVLPSMLRRGSGHIVNIASLAGKKGAPYNSIYSASKAGLIMWTDAMRQELAGTGVEISVICPGYVSQAGMTFDTHVPAPSLAGTSTPTDVAIAVLRAIKQNKAEVIVNQGFMRGGLTRLLFAIGQVSPRFGDAVYRWLGVTKLNQMRVENLVAVSSHPTLY